MVRSLIALEPMGYIFPRRPPVPKGMIVQKASSSACHFSLVDVLGDLVGVVGVLRLSQPIADVLGGARRELVATRRQTWTACSRDSVDMELNRMDRGSVCCHSDGSLSDRGIYVASGQIPRSASLSFGMTRKGTMYSLQS